MGKQEKRWEGKRAENGYKRKCNQDDVDQSGLRVVWERDTERESERE